MGESEFIAISHLFDSVGVIEKGIEKIYHYLLLHKKIDNLKDVTSNYGLTLKRGYKICAVLNELGLVQIFDRPMKIHLSSDLIPIWQVLIHKRIEELQSQFQVKRVKCERALDDFINNYSLEELVTQEPVEFINFTVDNIEDIYYPFAAKSNSKIAIGIQYENPLMPYIGRMMKNDLSEKSLAPIRVGMLRILENLGKIDVRVIFHNELVKILLNSREYELLNMHFKSFGKDYKINNIEVHITEEPFSNFNLTDNELVQPSFDPSNKLIGAYITRNKNIYQIFEEKFNELFSKGTPINEFIQQDKDLVIAPLTDIQCVTLCML